jgi:predicted anti-sigma-YlaC factor YlaD
MACPFPPDELSAYVDGELGEGQQDNLEKHLQHCAACAQIVASFRTIEHHLRAQPEVAAPARLRERVMAQVRTDRTPAPMTCAAAQQDASAYMDAELEPRAAARLEAHLFECDSCLRQFALMQACAAAQQTDPVTPPARLRPRILAAVGECQRKWLAGRRWLRGAAAVCRVLAPAVATAVVAALGLYWIERPSKPSPPTVAISPRPEPAVVPPVAPEAISSPAATSERPVPRDHRAERVPRTPKPLAAVKPPTPTVPANAGVVAAGTAGADDFWGQPEPAPPAPTPAPAPDVDNVNPTSMAMLPPMLVQVQSHIAPVATESHGL